jgi:hypothetical protein
MKNRDIVYHTIDYDKLMEINLRKSYNLKITRVGFNSVYVFSGVEEWIIDCVGEDHLILKHKNTRADRDKYHIQHHFSDYVFVLDYIHKHKNKWKSQGKCGKVERIKHLLESINR